MTMVDTEKEDHKVSFQEEVDIVGGKPGVIVENDRAVSQESSQNGSKYANLRSSLTRAQTDRDPFYFYDVTKSIGEGSMGAVRLVKKRADKVGGSARRDFREAVKRQKRDQKCLNIPIIGGLFRMCVDGDLKDSSRFSINRKSSFQDLLGSRDDPMNASFGSDASSISGSNRSASSVATVEIIYAMKSIVLSHVTKQEYIDELRNEIDILKKLDHPHIVRAIETFEHKKEIFIVMELCSGGDLYARDPYTENEAARIVSSILSAVAYMHSKNISHRDLKYENILFVNDSPKAEVKLIDFGLSKIYGDAHLTEGVGTIYTMAPEVLLGKYTHMADMWSIGVIAYMLLSSQLPFYGRKRSQIIQLIMTCKYDFQGRRWRKISQQASDFIEDLLVVDTEKRADAETAVRATWLNRRYAATTRAPHEEEEELARASMLRFAGYTKLKKMALMVVAHKSSSEEIGILRKVFQKFDTRRDGSISFQEFSEAMSKFGHSDEDLRDMFHAVDLDGTGRIRYTEFIAATIEAHGAISEERLAEAFDRLDSDDSGYISAENLVELLGKDFPRSEIDAIIAEADLTKDNLISYSEFLALWENKVELDKDENMKLIGGHARNPSADFSSVSYDSSDPVEKEASEAHAEFLLEKHDSSKHHTLYDGGA